MRGSNGYSSMIHAFGTGVHRGSVLHNIFNSFRQSMGSDLYSAAELGKSKWIVTVACLDLR